MTISELFQAIETVDLSTITKAIEDTADSKQRELLVHIFEYQTSLRQAKIIREEGFTL